MHDDVPVLEQVSYQTCFLTSKHFAHFFFLRTSSPKALGKDSQESDQDKEMHSASETESEGHSDYARKNRMSHQPMKALTTTPKFNLILLLQTSYKVIFNLRATLTWCLKLKILTRTWML